MRHSTDPDPASPAQPDSRFGLPRDFGHAGSGVPRGWMVVARARNAGVARGRAAPSGCFVLINPAEGAVLLDIAPGATPDAEARLRQAIQAGGADATLATGLPVRHVRLEPRELPKLAERLRAAFNDRALPVAADWRPESVWMRALLTALAADASWEVTATGAFAQPPLPAGQAPVKLRGRPAMSRSPTQYRGQAASTRPGGPLRPTLVGLGVGGAFLAGLLCGALLPLATERRPATVSAGAPDPPNLATASLAVTVLPASGAGRSAEDGPGLPLEPPATPRPLPRLPAFDPPDAEASREPPASAPPALSLSPLGERPTEPVALSALPAIAAPSAHEPVTSGAPPARLPAETAALQATPSIAAPSAAPMRTPARRPPVPLDQRCAAAQFRWQQGEQLSWGEMAYIRQGCVAARTR
jgi:hypothetical protein